MLPPCNHCGGATEAIAVGPEGHKTWFVMCQNKAGCGSRGMGRPLSNGKGTKQAAEDEWVDTCRKRKLDE